MISIQDGDVEKYLKIEFYHSLDSTDLHYKGKSHKSATIDSVTDFNLKTLLSLLNRFYSFLAELRYSTNLDLKDYENTANRTYEEYSKGIDSLIVNLGKRIHPGKFSSDSFEVMVILNYYEFITKELALSLKNKRRGEAICETVARLFVKNRASKIETDDQDRLDTLIRDKTQRYAGRDRARYWRETLKECSPPITLDSPQFRAVNDRIWKFITQEAGDVIQVNRLMASLLLLLLSKYHISLHKYAHGAYEFRKFSQHQIAEKQRQKAVERAQKVFTFTKLIAKYHPLVFVSVGTNKERSSALAKAIEILSYIRRGEAYLSLGMMEKAFNDFTAAQKQARLLRDMHEDSTEGIIRQYPDLFIPYAYSLKGELYRRDHAFHNAHQYFFLAQREFEGDRQNKQTEMKDALNRSMKLVRIKMAGAKALFELGEFRRALEWYFNALRHLLTALGCLKAEQPFDHLISYLGQLEVHRKVIKKDLFCKLLDVTNAIQEIVGDKGLWKSRYGIFFSDLLNRISLVLFLLNLPDYDRVTVQNQSRAYESAGTAQARDTLRNDLSRNLLCWRWLLLALKLNPNNSLARFNQIIFRLEASNSEVKQEIETMIRERGVKELEEDLLIELGGPRDILYRRVSRAAVQNMDVSDEHSKERIIARDLLQKLVLHTEEFAMKNAELYQYLMKQPHELLENNSSDVYLYALQRWSSINPALPRPSTFKMKGGGYYIVFRGKGIAIDPGFNFVENLYSEGFSIADIHYVIVTHDHIDHTADVDTILSLHYRRSKIEESEGRRQKNGITLLLNPTVSSRYSYVLHQDPRLCKKIELTSGTSIPVEGFQGDLVIEPTEAIHHDLSSPKFSHSIGLNLVFFPGKPGSRKLDARKEGAASSEDLHTREIRIGITGDTSYNERIVDRFLDTDVFITHVNSATFEQLAKSAGSPFRDKRKINGLLDDAGKCVIKDEILYSLGYHSAGERDEHMGLHGVLEAHAKFASTSGGLKSDRLFIVSEISEEMGSYRHKLASLLNKYTEASGVRCATSDIGMVVRIRASKAKRKIEILCSRCRLNNDYSDDDKFHNPSDIKEVCLKGEDEGIFYYCPRHDPEGSAREKVDSYGFAERIERYQPFKIIDLLR
jgi:ribonuclease BN (tRNA processing enzyme)